MTIRPQLQPILQKAAKAMHAQINKFDVPLEAGGLEKMAATVLDRLSADDMPYLQHWISTHQGYSNQQQLPKIGPDGKSQLTPQEEIIYAASENLYPFVTKYKLPMNPEDIDELAVDVILAMDADEIRQWHSLPPKTGYKNA